MASMYNMRDVASYSRRASEIYFNSLEDDDGRPFYAHDQDLQHGNFLPAYHQIVRSRVKNLCLPLLEVAVQVTVDGTVSRTVLTQSFINGSQSTLKEATYTFPLYDGAAVVSFHCAVGRDKVLEGIAKRKAEARSEYEAAKANGQVVALLEEHTTEIFETEIGNIPPQTTIQVRIAYVQELKAQPENVSLLKPDVGGDGLLVTVPTSIAPRYGTPPFNTSDLSTPKVKNGLEIVVKVTSPVPIASLESYTHPIFVAWDSNNADLTSTITSDRVYPSPVGHQNATAKLSNRFTFLDRDFTLLIRTNGKSLLSSRAVFEPSSDPGSSTAMMLSIQPRTLFPPTEYMYDFQGEIILLADRSGSMCGERMNTLRTVLQIFIKSLPEQCLFNIISFGSTFEALWNESVPYNENNVQAAMRAVASFEANLGGTEMRNALEFAVHTRSQRPSSCNKQVILLTDGQIWDTESVLGLIRKHHGELKAVRFFAIGIGGVVSHQLIEGIGRCGGGYAEVILNEYGGLWDKTVIRMLKGALMPASWEYEIEMDGKPMQRLTSTNTASGEPALIQAPFVLPTLHPFTRQSVFFLIDADIQINRIVVNAKTPSGHKATAMLTVERSTVPAGTIHYLAAKAAIKDLESGQSWIHKQAYHGEVTMPMDTSVDQEGERLALRYQMSSKWTSFVAVERTSPITLPDTLSPHSRFYSTNLVTVNLEDRADVHVIPPHVYGSAQQWQTFSHNRPLQPPIETSWAGGPCRKRPRRDPNLRQSISFHPVQQHGQFMSHSTFHHDSLQPRQSSASSDGAYSPYSAQTNGPSVVVSLMQRSRIVPQQEHFDTSSAGGPESLITSSDTQASISTSGPPGINTKPYHRQESLIDHDAQSQPPLTENKPSQAAEPKVVEFPTLENQNGGVRSGTLHASSCIHNSYTDECSNDYTFQNGPESYTSFDEVLPQSPYIQTSGIYHPVPATVSHEPETAYQPTQIISQTELVNTVHAERDVPSLDSVVRAQGLNGHFDLPQNVRQDILNQFQPNLLQALLNHFLVRLPDRTGEHQLLESCDNQLVNTLIAVFYIEQSFPECVELWELIITKANHWLSSWASQYDEKILKEFTAIMSAYWKHK